MKKLKKIVETAQRNDAIADELRSEIVRVTEHAVALDDKSLDAACDAAYDHIATQRRLHREIPKFSPSLLLRMVEHSSPLVRRLAAQSLPSAQLKRLMSDRSHAVLVEVARRVGLSELDRLVRSQPASDELATIRRERLREADEKDGMLWMSGKRLGDATKSKDVPLTPAWYENLARIIVDDVGALTLASSSVAMYDLARQFVQHVRTTRGVEVDVDALVDALNDRVDEIESMLPMKDELKLTVESLRRVATLQETIVLGGDDVDAVEELMSERCCDDEYVERAGKIFSIDHGAPARSTARALLRESFDVPVNLPTAGKLPNGDIIRAIDERALDRYVRCWNDRWRREGSCLRMEWTNDGSLVEFEVLA